MAEIMTHAQPSIEELFGAAMELPSAAERAAYLDQACGDDLETRRQVERLLAAHLDAGSFLAGPPSVVTALAESPAEEPGEVIGHYKLLERIGEGGMGVVYVAEQQEPIRRRVALKVIKPGMDSKQVVARFEAERQALAMMDHPNIAHVLDAGTTDRGRPYFAMELVKGVPVTDYCDQQRLTTNQRLELFLAVCSAVQHAHQKGLIHRDIKPSNVLVTVHDVTPVVKIIDFGIAKAIGQQLTDKTVYTGFSQMVGTPLYMSPEQAGLSGLDIDTRSDIYALGVLLYELLTGTTPFEAESLKTAGYDEMRRIIREDEPPRPSARLSTLQAATLATVADRHGVEPRRLSQQVRGELDWIVMKTLEKDRNRRYETASALAMDVQRHLNDEPVQACPPSASYRLKKFLRKYRIAVVAAASAVAVLLIAVAGLAVSNRMLRKEQEQTRWERDQKEAARQDEIKRRELARRALDAMSSQVIDGWLAQQRELSPEHQAFLKQTLTWYEELAAEVGEDPESRFGVAKAYQRVGGIEDRLGQKAEAESAFRRADDLMARLVEEFPGKQEYRNFLGTNQNSLGRLLRATGRAREAEPVLRRSLVIWKELADEFPDVAEYRYALSLGCNNLGALLGEWGDRECVPLWLRAAALQDQLVQDFPKVEKYREAAAMTHNNFGIGNESTGKPATALFCYGRALELRKGLVRDFPWVPRHRLELAATYRAMGRVHAANRRLAEAEPAYRQALDLFTKLAEDFPGVPDYRVERARMLDHMGDLLNTLGRRPEAEPAYRQAVNLFEELVKAFPKVPEYLRFFGEAQHGLGRLLVQMGRPEEAEQAYRKALTLLERLIKDSRDKRLWRARASLPTIHSDLGELLAQMGRPAEAEQAYREAVVLHTERIGEYPGGILERRDLANTCIRLGKLKRSQGQPAAALTWYAKAIGTLVDTPFDGTKDEAWSQIRVFLLAAYQGRAMALLDLGDHTRAAATAQELTKLEKTPLPTSIYDAACVYALCSAAVRKDEKLPAGERAKLQVNYANDALKMLRDAIAKGFQDLAQIKKDPDLNVLRDREEFRKLVRELEAKLEAEPKKEP